MIRIMAPWMLAALTLAVAIAVVAVGGYLIFANGPN